MREEFQRTVRSSEIGRINEFVYPKTYVWIVWWAGWVTRGDIINYTNTRRIIFFSLYVHGKIRRERERERESGNESRRNYVHARNCYFYIATIFFSVNEYTHYAEHAPVKSVERILHVRWYTSKWVGSSGGKARGEKRLKNETKYISSIQA